jgi:hypothetical protein
MEFKVSTKLSLLVACILCAALGWGLATFVNTWPIAFIIIFGLASLGLGIFFFITILEGYEDLDDYPVSICCLSFLIGFILLGLINNSWYSHNGSFMYNTQSQQLETVKPSTEGIVYIVSDHVIPIRNVKGKANFNVTLGLTSNEVELDYIWNADFVEKHSDLDYKQITVAILDAKVKNSNGQFGPIELSLAGCDVLKVEGLEFDSCPLTITLISIN